ncbi:serine/arginine repetitive matrix protein 4 [Tachyglossus aculeatus]|uniref:serine/arginine repetitive matrix protein 4 n=1 Tax=Tachyglossus aculeatus TaxID=9261 RepID=UPI0018F41AB1|nr:serine/arginine repetitive matrix protein 4 [Tachyglossus aculeatus]
MASVGQGEKQLFEKFWRGTFKAVATPRPASIIVASITARRPLTRSETSSCLSYPGKDGNATVLSQSPDPGTSSTNGDCHREKDNQDLSCSRGSHASTNEYSTPPPSSRGKKKKKKSTRKRRRRSPSYSPSPVKKKKKKSSKKRKRNSSSSKKRRHRSQSRPRKSHRRHRHHARSDSSESRSSSCSSSRPRARSQEGRRKSRRRHSRHGSRAIRKGTVSPKARPGHPRTQTLQLYGLFSAKDVISQPGFSADLFTKTANQPDTLPAPAGGSQEYDSGNDTSSPPSTQASSSGSKDGREPRVIGIARSSGPGTSGQRKPVNSDNGSDSGHSFTTCSSRTKGSSADALSLDAQRHRQRRFSSPCPGCSEEKRVKSLSSPARCSLTRSSRSSSRSSPSPRHSSSRSRSVSSSGKRSYSRSSSYSSRQSPESRSSRARRSPSYTCYSPTRDREREHKYSSGEQDSHRERERRRRRSYSPMRKRRRDSPSHLEARRITSARKRPIPYYRPSPSSSSSSSSYMSWPSSPSRSPSRGGGRSRPRVGRGRSRTPGSSSSGGSSDGSSDDGRASGRTRTRSYDSMDSQESTGR